MKVDKEKTIQRMQEAMDTVNEDELPTAADLADDELIAAYCIMLHAKEQGCDVDSVAELEDEIKNRGARYIANALRDADLLVEKEEV